MKKRFLFATSILLSINLFPSCNNNKVTITFDPLDGKVVGSSSLTINKGTTWNQIANKPTAESNDPNVYTFSYWTKKNEGSESIPVPETFKFNENTTLYAIYENKPSTPFNTDSWENIIAEANKGKTSFENKYGQISSLIGQTRKVNTDIGERTVRLVASNHDVISKKQNKVSLLTFQFIGNVTAAKFNNSSNYNSYLSSPIRISCNEVYQSITNTTLKESINTVIKKSYSGGIYSTLNDYEEKLYVPSYSEVNGDNSNLIDEEPFEYYSSYPSSKRIKSSWTRTCSTQDNSSAYFINKNGRLEVIEGNAFSINPCFSIGSETGSPNAFKFYNASWQEIIDNSTEEAGGLTKLKQVYGLDSFVGLTHPITIAGNDYLVRVIGENEDYISRNKYGALTFMLTSPYASSSIFNSDASYNGYKNSTIEKFANDLIAHFPSELNEDTVNSVINYSLIGNHGSGIIQTTDKISLLSAKELGVISNDSKITIFPEGYTYSYFNSYDTLDNKYRFDTGSNYYLRSSDYNYAKSNVLIIKQDETKERSDYIGSYVVNPTSDIPSLIFKFSVGVSNISDTPVNFYSNSILSSNPISTVKNDDYYETTLAINAESGSKVYEHCSFPDEFKIVVNTNNQGSFVLKRYSTLTESNVGYNFDSSSQILTLSTPNQIINKYFPSQEGVILKSIELVPELEIVDTDTWGVIYSNLNSGAGKEYYLPGVTKELSFNDKDYTIRLLDLNKDGTSTATFMFTEPLLDSNNELISASYFTTGDYKYKWSESTLKATYQGYQTDLESALSSVLIPVTLKTVSKSTTYFDYASMSEEASEDTSDETIFSLSYDEIYTDAKKYSYFGIFNRIIKAQLFDGRSDSTLLFRDTRKASSGATRYYYGNYDELDVQKYIDVDASSVLTANITTNLYPCFVL